VDWNDDGSQLAAVGLRGGSDEGYIFVLDAATGETLYHFETPYGGFATVDWSPDSRFIAVGSYDQTVKIIDVQSRETVATLVGHRWVVDSLEWNSDGTRLVSSSSGDQQVILWDATTYEQIHRIEIGDPWTVAFSPDDQSIAMAGLPGLFVFPADLVIPEGSERGQYERGDGYLGTFAWSHDGTRIAFGNITFQPTTGERPNPQVHVVDSSDGTVLSNFEVPQGEKIFGIAWSPDDELIATYSIDGSVRIWEAATGTLLDSFPGNADYIERGLGFSPYGGRLAYGGSIPSNAIAEATAQTDGVDAVQALANSGVQIVVPAPSLERLQAIADACNAPTAVEQTLTASIQADQLTDFVAQVEALSEDTIPPACAADLIAVAEALQSR
jgi:WD40 repeat protein